MVHTTTKTPTPMSTAYSTTAGMATNPRGYRPLNQHVRLYVSVRTYQSIAFSFHNNLTSAGLTSSKTNQRTGSIPRPFGRRVGPLGATGDWLLTATWCTGWHTDRLAGNCVKFPQILHYSHDKVVVLNFVISYLQGPSDNQRLHRAPRQRDRTDVAFTPNLMSSRRKRQRRHS